MDDRLLTIEDVSELIRETEGIRVKPQTLTFYASQSRRRKRSGTLTVHDMPIPDPADAVRVRRSAPGKGPRMVTRPRWREPAIRAWRQAGRRPLPERERDDAGRYLGAAS